MTDQPKEPRPVSQKQAPCGCLQIDFDNGAKVIRPCLSDALMNAGTMLQEAALRIREAEEARRQQMVAMADAELRKKLKL